jgi:Reverse transcriptase (RNA-dependent DNA polymerase)
MSVLQGSSLGPILFLCFINDIFNCTELALFLFPDDTNALAQHKNLSELIKFVNSELQKLATWFKANNLVINASRTKFMIFRTRNRQINLQNLDIFIDFNEPTAIERPELKVKLQRIFNDGDRENQTYKILGILFDEYLSFDKHVLYVQRKVAKSLFLLNRSKNFLTFRARMMLYYATVHAHLLYCPIILSVASKTNLNRIALMQKKAIRLVYLTSYFEHTATLFYDAKNFTILLFN